MTEDHSAASQSSQKGFIMGKIEIADPIVLGDPVPWFGAPLIGDGAFNLQVAAGRWIVLSFLGSPANPKVKQELAGLLRDTDLFDEDRIVFYGVLTAPPDDPAHFIKLCTPEIAFIADYDSAISRAYGAAQMPRTIVLDPMLRVVADIAWDHADGHVETVRNVLAGLLEVDDSAGVPLTARHVGSALPQRQPRG